MSASNVSQKERGAALLLTVMALAIVSGIIAYAMLDTTQANISTEAQMANHNQARTAALMGIAGLQNYLNSVQDAPNTATSGGSSCGNNGICSFINTLTSAFWGSSQTTVVPPNGGLGAIGYFNGQEVSINNVSLKNQSPYINATVSLHIIGNTYQIALPATNTAAAQPAQPGLITVMSQGISGGAAATAEAVLGPVFPAIPGVQNTTLSLGGDTTAGQIVNQSPPAQHTYLNAAGTLTTPTNEAPQGFTGVSINTSSSFVTISASTLQSQANIVFLPPGNGQQYPQVEFQNISGNSELNSSQEYALSPTAISSGVCVSFLGCGSVFGIPYGTRVPIFSSGTSISYDSSSKTWSISNSSSPSSALLIPGAAYFQGNVTLGSGIYNNAIISTGNITDNGTVYAPNYAGPTSVCGSPLQLFPNNFCGPQGTQFIPASIGNIALYAQGAITIASGASVYGDVLSGGNLTTLGSTNFYGFVVAEGSNNSLSGTTTINNAQSPQTFNPTPLNANQYSATTPSVESSLNNPIGLLGLTWIN